MKLSENQKKVAIREFERLSYSKEARELFFEHMSPDTLTGLFKEFLEVMEFKWKEK